MGAKMQSLLSICPPSRKVMRRPPCFRYGTGYRVMFFPLSLLFTAYLSMKSGSLSEKWEIFR